MWLRLVLSAHYGAMSNIFLRNRRWVSALGLPAVKRRPLARASTAIAVAAGLALAGACGGGDGGGGGEDSLTVGVLLPGGGASRFGQSDRPLIEKKLKQLCPDCPVTVAATPDPAVQRQQLEAMITKGVDVLILAAIDAEGIHPSVEAAHRAGIPVVAYDRLAQGPISGYVTFDGATVGRLQGEALLKAMGAKADGGQIVMMNGATIDPNAGFGTSADRSPSSRARSRSASRTTPSDGGRRTPSST